MKHSVEKEIQTLFEEQKKRTRFSIGYPVNLCFDYSALTPFLNFFLNNIGDPFAEPIYKIHTRPFERKVLTFFARLYDIPLTHFWGYITSGGTEGNMYGLFLARERYPDGILYFSKDTHYSISKIARALKMKAERIPSLTSGEIDYAALEHALKKNIKRPAIININIGTTMKGAIDDIDRIAGLLKKHRINKHHIHCDAALLGVMLPYLPGARKLSFKKPVDSIAVSGHKFIGSPVPCGVVITRKRFVKNIARDIEYVRISDTTLSGCRSGFAALVLWYAIRTRGTLDFRKEAVACISRAKYLFGKLHEMEYPAVLNPFSNIVIFKKPPARLVEKWQLAVEGPWAHVVVMQHVTKEKIDAFLADVRKASRKKTQEKK